MPDAKVLVVITQNVDDLFERAGCLDVIHLHGFMPNIRCEKCGFIKTIGYTEQSDELCEKCQGSMRPDIVFFNEPAPMYAALHIQITDVDFLVVIGTSGNVVNMDRVAKKASHSILNNLEKSSAINARNYTKVIYNKATVAIDEIVKGIEAYLV